MKRTRSHIVLLICLVLTACSPSKRFNVLSFFFDGVPDPAKSVETSPFDSLMLENPEADSLYMAMALEPAVNYHDPYQKKQCMKCHDSNAVGELLYEEPQLCYSCHDNYSTKYIRLHGPVDIGFCLVCHEPHMSKMENLLSLEGNALCFPCHIDYEVKQPDRHIDIGEDLCRKCHHPHGENER
jgi:predicted CXXCH cytochrome family protein